MKPIKVLVAHPMPADATNFYRILGPLSHLQKHGIIEIIDGTQTNFNFGWTSIIQADVVYLGRPSTHEFLQIIQMARELKKPVISSYDDDYLNIPETNPRYELYADPGRRAIILDCMRLSDAIDCSTKAIADEIKKVIPDANTVVIPNAYDETIFRPPSQRNPEKIVVFRAGDTKGNDLELHKEAILKAFFKHTEYTWVFMGHVPIWFASNLEVPDSRVRLYGFENLMTYFHQLMELRPEIVICPLALTPFNLSKSNNNWIEATLAGAVCVAPKFLPEFDRPGVITYNSYEDFSEAFTFAVNRDQAPYFETSRQEIPSLKKVNELRKELLFALAYRPEQFVTPNVVKLNDVVPFNDEQFFTYALEHGHIQENENYLKGHERVIDYLIEKCKPESVLELGSGPGVTIELFHDKRIYALGVEKNEYFIDYFKKRNPLSAAFMVHGDITDDLVFPRKFDLGVSIEVFEHIDITEDKWSALILSLATNCKHFYFSSTQYRTNLKFDKQWSHINIRRWHKWVELFEKNGWEYVDNPKVATTWDILFRSKLYDAEVLKIQ